MVNLNKVQGKDQASLTLAHVGCTEKKKATTTEAISAERQEMDLGISADCSLKTAQSTVVLKIDNDSHWHY